VPFEKEGRKRKEEEEEEILTFPLFPFSPLPPF
jgi:hypothetical protein